MRLNKFIAANTGISRRVADKAIEQGHVRVNGEPPKLGQDVTGNDTVTLNGKPIAVEQKTTIMLNKPVGYVVSRDGQGSKTIYELLPKEFHHLKPIGRLDKDSSGLLLLTNDGELANELTHPRYHKQKVYEITLYKPLQPLHRQMISDHGLQLEDGPSRLQLERIEEGRDVSWRVTMSEGRNRQIRRTFLALGYGVKTLHRTHFGNYHLEALAPSEYTLIN